MDRARAARSGLMVCGIVMGTAIIFVFVPSALMVWIGQVLHLPPFEVTPVFDYMARYLSLVHFFFGLLFIYLSLHMDGHLRLIRRIGLVAFAGIPVAVFIHAVSGLPLWWAAGDMAGLCVAGVFCRLTPCAQRAEGKLDETGH